ncbi:MAG: hypothetical protein JO110_25260 [Acetobacteraceae bacterium]|nr:hypothetical protein [Acetobacteraceae bacterium]
MAAIQNDVVAEVGRAIIVAVAPQELPLFRPISEAFFKDPGRARPRGRGRDDILGFGTVEASLLTPVVLTMVTHVGMFLVEEIGKGVAAATGAIIQEQIKRLFRREHGAISLQPKQLAEVRRIALATAQEFSMPDANAKQLADALICQLTIGNPE